jgi:Predicted transcriptional regulators
MHENTQRFAVGGIILTDIHDRIKDLREENHYKQRQVADYLGISQQAYSYYELDKRELPSRHVVNLAKLYQVSTDFILGMEPSPAGSYDLNARFIQDVSLKEVLINLGQLNKDGRQELIKYLSYLSSTQGGKNP